VQKKPTSVLNDCCIQTLAYIHSICKFLHFWHTGYRAGGICTGMYAWTASTTLTTENIHQIKLELSLIAMRKAPPIHPLSHQIRIFLWIFLWIYKNFEKKGHNPGTLWPRPSHVYHAYIYVIEIMCSKFHLDDLKTVGGVGDTIFHQQTNRRTVCWLQYTPSLII